MKTYALILSLGLMSACAPASDTKQSSQAPLEAPPQTSETQTTMANTTMNLNEIDFTSIRGEPMPFSDFSDQVVLVVNTASRCGYTRQYAGLQELHTTFEDQGFTVLGVPSNDFGAQEPGTEEQIATFCEINYGVEFPLTRKTTVVGAEQHPFYRLAVESLGDKAEPKWNFHKVLVGRDGRFLQAYPSSIRPADVELVADIERALTRVQ